MNIQAHLSKLGLKVTDYVTGFTGVITSVSFDLYGCIQALVNPGADKDGKLQDQTWFDIARLKTLDPIPVMKSPDFEFGLVAEGKKGPAAKPLFNKA